MPKPMFIDLSHHNVVPVSFVATAAAGVVGVIHKLTEGTGFVDDKVRARRFLAADAGMLWGIYHFIRPGDARNQARWFIDRAEFLGVEDAGTLFALDWEDAGVSLDDALSFLDEVEKLTGHVPVLYSGHILKEALGGKPDPRLDRYRLWLAQYASAPTLPPGYSTYWGWQFTDKGAVPGVEPPTDLNDYPGTADSLAHNWSGAQAPPPAPGEVTITVGDIVIRITAPPGTPIDVE